MDRCNEISRSAVTERITGHFAEYLMRESLVHSSKYFREIGIWLSKLPGRLQWWLIKDGSRNDAKITGGRRIGNEQSGSYSLRLDTIYSHDHRRVSLEVLLDVDSLQLSSVRLVSMNLSTCVCGRSSPLPLA